MYRHAHRYAAVAMLLAAVLVKPTAVGKAVGEEAGVRAGCMRVDTLFKVLGRPSAVTSRASPLPSAVSLGSMGSLWVC